MKYGYLEPSQNKTDRVNQVCKGASISEKHFINFAIAKTSYTDHTIAACTPKNASNN